MAGFSERLQFIIDANGAGAISTFKNVGDSAATNLGGVQTHATGIGGAFEKAAAKSPLLTSALDKVGLSGQQAGSMIQTALPAAALAGGAAIGAFAVKAVGDFQDLALSILDFQRASGATAEESSRLVTVLDDYGIAADVGARAMQTLGRNAENAPEKFAKFGIEIARNKDGTTDLNQTLLNAAEAYESSGDAATKAALAAALFGARGGKELIPLLEKGAEGADGLAAALENISGQQIMSQEQLNQAEDTMLSLDRLSDAAHEFTLAVGSGLAPAVEKAADQLSGLLDKANSLLGPVGGLDKAVGLFSDVLLSGGGAAFVAKEAYGQLKDVFVETESKVLNASTITALLTEKQVALTGSTTAVEHALGLEATAHSMNEGAALADALAADADALAKDEAEQAAKDLETAVKNEAAAHRDAAAALIEKTDTQRDAAEGTLDLHDAERDWAATLAELPGKLQDVQTGEDGVTRSMDDQSRVARENEQAISDATRGAGELADANVDLAKKQFEAAGATLTQAQETDIWNSTMITAASQASGPLRTAILDHIQNVNDIPEEKMTEIEAAMAAGDIDEVNRLIADASRTRTADVNADAHTAAAEAALNQLARDRFVRLHPDIHAPGGGRAAGGPVRAGVAVEVGEQGRELFVPSTDGRILSHGDTMAAMGARGGQAGGAMFNLTVNAGMGANGNQIGNEIVRAIKVWEMSNGDGWRR